MVWGHHNKYINVISSVELLSPFGINPTKKPSCTIHPSSISLRRKLKKKSNPLPSQIRVFFFFLSHDVTFLTLSPMPAHYHPVSVLTPPQTWAITIKPFLYCELSAEYKHIHVSMLLGVWKSSKWTLPLFFTAWQDDIAPSLLPRCLPSPSIVPKGSDSLFWIHQSWQWLYLLLIYWVCNNLNSREQNPVEIPQGSFKQSNYVLEIFPSSPIMPMYINTNGPILYLVV